MNQDNRFDINSEAGQGLVEYGLILVVVSVVAIGILGTLAASILGLGGWSLF
jgi:Flp pilus assembly pilin Flp